MNINRKSNALIIPFRVIVAIFVSHVIGVIVSSNAIAQKVERQIEEVTAQSNCESKVCSVLTGKLLDPQGSVVMEADVLFVGKGAEEKVTPNLSGYEINLAAGIYEISLPTRYETLVFRRARISVTSERLVLNLYPHFKRVSYGDTSTQYRYEELSGFPRIQTGLNVVVGFTRKRQSKKRKRLTKFSDAMLTLNQYTISADSLVRDRVTNQFRAFGHVWIEDGQSRKEYGSCVFEVVGDRPVFLETR